MTIWAFNSTRRTGWRNFTRQNVRNTRTIRTMEPIWTWYASFAFILEFLACSVKTFKRKLCNWSQWGKASHHLSTLKAILNTCSIWTVGKSCWATIVRTIDRIVNTRSIHAFDWRYLRTHWKSGTTLALTFKHETPISTASELLYNLVCHFWISHPITAGSAGVVWTLFLFTRACNLGRTFRKRILTCKITALNLIIFTYGYCQKRAFSFVWHARAVKAFDWRVQRACYFSRAIRGSHSTFSIEAFDRETERTVPVQGKTILDCVDTSS